MNEMKHLTTTGSKQAIVGNKAIMNYLMRGKEPSVSLPDLFSKSFKCTLCASHRTFVSAVVKFINMKDSKLSETKKKAMIEQFTALMTSKFKRLCDYRTHESGGLGTSYAHIKILKAHISILAAAFDMRVDEAALKRPCWEDVEDDDDSDEGSTAGKSSKTRVNLQSSAAPRPARPAQSLAPTKRQTRSMARELSSGSDDANTDEEPDEETDDDEDGY
tara:strand:- start:183 stop:836 length:654 start_codon:yes stop_codon:yes gene_type:complete